jgi:hypothetical protein
MKINSMIYSSNIFHIFEKKILEIKIELFQKMLSKHTVTEKISKSLDRIYK